jgi:spermidine/putrescine transport system permease protein
MQSQRNRLLSVYALLVYAFLFAPIVILIVFSFNASKDNFVWTGFTLDWYPVLFRNEDMLDALFKTLQVALVAVVASTVLGTLLGIGLARMRNRYVGGVAETLIILPMVAPEIIMGLSLLLFFAQLFSARGSLAQISIAHITFCVSYVAVVVRARAVSLDPHIVEAARDLGASGLGAFRYVTLPLLAPAILAGAMLSFALSFDDLIITTFNAGPGSSTLPLYLYSRIRFGVTPEINAISTIIVAVTGVAILLAWRFGQTRDRVRAEADSESAEPVAQPSGPGSGGGGRGPQDLLRVGDPQ